MSDQIEREVGQRRIDAGDARTAVIRRRYDAPIEDVWDACTNPERLRRWFVGVEGELHPGGTFSLDRNASGEIRRCEPPRLLELTWRYKDRPVDEVALHLSPAEGGATLLELEHATVMGEVEWEGRLVDVVAGVGVGWELGIVGLDLHLRDQPIDRDLEKPEMKALIERSESAWADALEAA
jgi:uncharacterized protein YndB with AHSA1/START domain